MTNELFDTVEIEAQASGKEESVLEQITKQLDEQRKTAVVDRSVVNAVSKEGDTVYDVVIPAKEAIRVRNTNYQAAVAEARKAAEANNYVGDITVRVTESYKVAYEIVDAKASGRTKKDVLETLAREEAALREKYAGKIAESPQNVVYRVAHYDSKWVKKAAHPKGKIVTEATSNLSFDEAEASAKDALGKKNSKSMLYEAAHSFKVGGARAEAKAAAEPASSSSYAGRAGGTSAYTPVYAAKELSVV